MPLSQKVLDDKPTGAVDECFMGATLTETTDAAACAAAFPYFADARLVAGSPWTDNAMQCSLQPLDRASYSVTFTDDQWARLQAAFPDGVCDWSVAAGRLPAVGAVAHVRRRPRRGVGRGGTRVPPGLGEPLRAQGHGAARRRSVAPIIPA